jgi:hypothetical protein
MRYRFIIGMGFLALPLLVVASLYIATAAGVSARKSRRTALNTAFWAGVEMQRRHPR